MEKNIIKNNLEHTVRGNMLDGHKRDILAWALRKLQYFWQPLYHLVYHLRHALSERHRIIWGAIRWRHRAPQRRPSNAARSVSVILEERICRVHILPIQHWGRMLGLQRDCSNGLDSLS